MRKLIAFLLIPCLTSAQINPAFVVKTGLLYNKLEYKGNGLFGFETNDRFGYMDKTGKVIIPAEYSYKLNDNSIPLFYKGVIAVKKDSKMGIIDKTGKIIIPFEYDNTYTHYQVNDAFPVLKKENGEIDALCFIIPQLPEGDGRAGLQKYLVSLQTIEEKTGIKFANNSSEYD